MLKVGEKAPDFILPSTNDTDFHLYEHQKGKPCILFFYPKDFTPGCTREVCAFRDQFEIFRNSSVDVFGINFDSVSSHKKFKVSNDLPFELLTDAKGEIIKKYHAKLPFVNLTKRVTYLLDANQKILAIYNDLFAARNHVFKMLENLDLKIEKF